MSSAQRGATARQLGKEDQLPLKQKGGKWLRANLRDPSYCILGHKGEPLRCVGAHKKGHLHNPILDEML